MNRRTVITPLIAFAAFALSAISRPLWFDEVLTLSNFVIGRSLAQIYHSYVIPNNHLLYSFLLRLWCEVPMLCGGIVEHFRLLTVLLGVGFLVLFFFGFRKRLGTPVVTLLLLGFVLAPAALIYGTAVRGYMLSALLMTGVLLSALRFAAAPTGKNGVLYGIFCLLETAVIPSNLFAVGCAVCAVLPVIGADFWKKRRFYFLAGIPFAAFLLFYGPIFPDLMRCLNLREGRGDRWGVLLQTGLTAGSFLTVLLPAALAGTFGALSLRRLKRTWPRWVLPFLPLLPCFLLVVAPFPRTFFPCVPVLLYVAGLGGKHLFALLRMRKGKASGKKLFYLCFFVLLLAGSFVQPRREMISDLYCGGGRNDDFFAPYYVRRSFAPGSLVGCLQKEFPRSRIYCSFDSDPYAILFCADSIGAAERFAFDNPRGRAQGKFDLVIARYDEPVETLEARLGVKLVPVSSRGIPAFYRLYRPAEALHE